MDATDRPTAPSLRVPCKWRAAALYGALTLLLTFPLVLHPARTVLADNPDDELFMWTLAWDAHAFLHQPLSIFDANILHPEHRTLAYSENLIGSALIAAPVLWATDNPVLALNVVALVSCALCGLGAYVLGWRIGMSVPAALVCGIIFAFAPARFFRTPQLHLGAVQWMPFALASLHAYLEGGRPVDLRLAALFFSLQALASGHGAVFLTLAALCVAAWRFGLGEPLGLDAKLRDLGLAGAVLLTPAVLVFLPYQTVQQTEGLRRGLETWVTRPESLLASPTHFDMYVRPWLTASDINATASAFLFPGYLPILLAALALLWPGGDSVDRRAVSSAAGSPATPVSNRLAAALEWAILAATALAATISAIGPFRLAWDGVSLLRVRDAARPWMAVAVLASVRVALARRVPLALSSRLSAMGRSMSAWAVRARRRPTGAYVLLLVLSLWLAAVAPPSPWWRYGLWRFVYQLPGFSLIRIASRFITLTVLALAVLGGAGVDRVTSRLRASMAWTVALAVMALLVAEFWAVPMPVSAYTVTIPAADRWLATRPTPFVVAETPISEGAARLQTTYMLHSTAHWQKTVHGYSGFTVRDLDDLYAELSRFPDERSILHLQELGVTYVVVHNDRYAPGVWKAVESRLAAFGSALHLEYEDPDGRVYSIHR